MSSSKKRINNSCRVCASGELVPFFDLGEQPFANSLLKRPTTKEKKYPLALQWCRACSLVQLSYTADPQDLFSHYVWVTGTSKVAHEHAERFCTELLRRTKDPGRGYTLEVASNDGTFLRPFMEEGLAVLGVDPAKNIVELATREGVPTRCEFWGAKSARALVDEKGPARMIFARNVLPHVANTRDFVKGLALALDEEGTLAIEAHYAKIISDELHYDSIYHEHLCYFTLKSVERLLNDFDLKVFDITKSPISGGSLIVYAGKGAVRERASLKRFREQEKKSKINSLANWRQFARRSEEHKKELVRLIERETTRGTSVVGYGASARSSTLLNFCGIGSSALPMIADQNPLKQKRYTAGSHIFIDTPESVIGRNPATVVVLAWNFFAEIKERLEKEFEFRGSYIVPLPGRPRVKKAGK